MSSRSGIFHGGPAGDKRRGGLRFMAGALCGLLLTGTALQPLKCTFGSAWPRDARRERVRDAGSILARDLAASVFGGLRALAADGLWLRTYAAWARRDLPSTGRLIRLVTLVDERPLDFWINGARILAYDMPAWRLAERGGIGGRAVRRRIVGEQAALALDYLAEGRRSHPDSAELCIEMANIHLNLTRNLDAAARWYREAALKPDAPPYAARIYADLLCRQGHYREAHAWLCALYQRLADDYPKAMRAVVRERIAALEHRLKLPERRRCNTLNEK